MPPPQLEDLWSKISVDDVYRFRFSKWDAAKVLIAATRHGLLKSIIDFLSQYKSIHGTDALKSTLRKSLSGYYSSFAQSGTHFALSVTNLNSSRREYFYKLPVGVTLPPAAREGSDIIWEQITGLELLLDALIGSTALPVLFPLMVHILTAGCL